MGKILSKIRETFRIEDKINAPNRVDRPASIPDSYRD